MISLCLIQNFEIWLTNSHHNIFWNDGENSFQQTRKYLRTITSGKQIII